LGSAPALELLLHEVRVLDALVVSGPAQDHRPPPARVRRAETFVVLADPPLQVVGAADVQRAVTTLDDVDPRHATHCRHPEHGTPAGNPDLWTRHAPHTRSPR